MNYIEACIKITPFSEEFADIVIAGIEELPFESFSVEDSCVKGYMSQDRFSYSNLKTVLSFFDNNNLFKIELSYKMIEGENWNALWESNFSPVVVRGMCTVKATFHKDLPITEYTIVIDPKMAFGTGHHQTTSLMIDALLDITTEGKRVLDMGCGTGILAILCALKGECKTIHAVDIDPDATNSAKENVTVNCVKDKIEVITGDASLIKKERYDLIIANINKNIVIADMKSYALGLVSSGLLLLSGFYSGDVVEVERVAANCGLKVLSQKEKDNWVVLKLLKS